MKTIKVSDELHKFLTEQSINKESYDQTIKRLLQEKWGVKIPEAVR